MTALNLQILLIIRYLKLEEFWLILRTVQQLALGFGASIQCIMFNLMVSHLRFYSKAPMMRKISGRAIPETLGGFIKKSMKISAVLITLLLCIEPLLCEEIKPSAYSNLQRILPARLKAYNPVETHFDILVSKPVGSGAKPSNNRAVKSVNATYQINHPKYLDRKALLTFQLNEYADQAAASDSFWRARRNFSEMSPPLFSNPRGFDLLGVKGLEVTGLTGNKLIRVSITSAYDHTVNFLDGSQFPNPDLPWYAGTADFMLDAWKEALSLPNEGRGIAPAESGSIMKRENKEDSRDNLDTQKVQNKKIRTKTGEVAPVPTQSSPLLRTLISPRLAIAALTLVTLGWFLRRIYVQRQSK